MKRRLTLRDETGRAILNCYACKTEGRMICDYFACQQRLIDRLADFEDAESREVKSVEVKDGKIVRISKMNCSVGILMESITWLCRFANM